MEVKKNEDEQDRKFVKGLYWVIFANSLLALTLICYYYFKNLSRGKVTINQMI